MKILLGQPRTNENKGPFIPFGQLTLAAHIEDVADVAISGNAFDGTLPTAETILEQVKSFQPDVVGITVCYAVAYAAAVDLARKVKQYNPDIRVIAGGHHATFSSHELLATGWFDAVFLGEGEVSLRRFVTTGDWRGVPGVAYLENGRVVETKRAPLLPMDELRTPAYHLLQKGMRILLGAETSRGCPFRCDFCETSVFFGNNRIRKKSAGRVIDDLRQIVETTGGGNFLLMDDCFSADMLGHVKPICEALIRAELPVNFCFQARLGELYRHQELIPLLARAGFGSVLMGVETIYPETLKAMQKGATYGRKEIAHMIKLCKDNGISFFAAICFGYPGETPAMVEETIDFIIANDVDSANITLATPVPGSPLYARAKANGELLSNEYRLFDGTHRLLASIPETSVEAVHRGIRKYYLRPEYVSKSLSLAIDPATAGWRAYAAAGAMSYNIATDKARPTSREDWSNLVQGLCLVLQKYPSRMERSFSGTVQLVVDGEHGVFVTVHEGIPKEVNGSDQADLVLAASGDAFLDILVWCPVDIVSACIQGIARLSGPATLERRLAFLRWLSDAQTILRWSIAMQGCVPVLRVALEERLKSGLSLRLGSLFHEGGRLFLGAEGLGGLVLHFQEATKISAATIALSRPRDARAEIPLTGDEIARLLHGGYDFLVESLQREPIALAAPAEPPLMGPAEFFATLPGKFRPERARELDLVVQYTIREDANGSDTWCLRLRRGELTVQHGASSDRVNAAVTLSDRSFRMLVNGKASPATLFHRGEMALTGLPQTMIKMASCFENLFGRPPA